MPILALLLVFLASCGKNEPKIDENPTKYPEIPPFWVTYEVEPQSKTNSLEVYPYKP